MELDLRRYPAITTHTIPQEYARHTMPGHEAIVHQGKFGILITQVLQKPDYTAVVNYFNLSRPIELDIRPDGPCLFLYYAIRNKGTIVLDEQLQIKITITEKNFQRLTLQPKKYTARFKVGLYRSLHLTVSGSGALKDPQDRINQLLDQYLEEMGSYILD